MEAMVGLVFTIVIMAFTLVIVVGSMLVSVAVPAAILYVIWKSSQQHHELLRTGVAAPARVVGLRETGMYINNQPQVAITLEVQPVDGDAFQGIVTQTISILQIPRVQPGSIVEVRFDPKNRARMGLVL